MSSFKPGRGLELLPSDGFGEIFSQGREDYEVSEGRHESGGVDGASTLLLEILFCTLFFFFSWRKRNCVELKKTLGSNCSEI